MGVSTGVDLKKLIKSSEEIFNCLNKMPDSKVNLALRKNMSKVKSQIEDNIGIIKINNIDKKNALDNDVISLLIEKLKNFDKDSSSLHFNWS